MKASHLNRLIHRWGSIVIALPALLVILTGIVLQLKKESAWIQPGTQKGSSSELVVTFQDILNAVSEVPEAEVSSWDDVDRLDVRPSKGMVKVRCRNRWEVQLDSKTADVLQVAYRRSDFIESLHDGSYFSDFAKLWIFLPTAIVFAVLWATGMYLFFLPSFARRQKTKRKQAAVTSSATSQA